jgi:hypothetical protein
VCTTAVTLCEIRYGIACLPISRRWTLLEVAADELSAVRVEPGEGLAGRRRGRGRKTRRSSSLATQAAPRWPVGSPSSTPAVSFAQPCSLRRPAPSKASRRTAAHEPEVHAAVNDRARFRQVLDRCEEVEKHGADIVDDRKDEPAAMVYEPTTGPARRSASFPPGGPGGCEGEEHKCSERE